MAIYLTGAIPVKSNSLTAERPEPLSSHRSPVLDHFHSAGHLHLATSTTSRQPRVYRKSNATGNWQDTGFVLLSREGGVRIFDRLAVKYVGPTLVSYRACLIWLADNHRDHLEMIGFNEAA